MAISGAVLAAERRLPDLGGRLAAPGARFLDIGTGAGWFAIAMARSHPNLTVVGIDIFAPALDLGHANVQEQGLADRVELRLQDATELDAPNGTTGSGCRCHSCPPGSWTPSSPPRPVLCIPVGGCSRAPSPALTTGSRSCSPICAPSARVVTPGVRRN